MFGCDDHPHSPVYAVIITHSDGVVAEAYHRLLVAVIVIVVSDLTCTDQPLSRQTAAVMMDILRSLRKI
jgi:hypothetical protein